MGERWYREAVIYCVEVDLFQDSNGDGWGDLAGLTSRLDYLSRLGVDCLWLNPIHPTPHRDAGYDVADYYGIDPRLGSLGDFTELVLAARARGIRILLDLVVNHTSDQHPWFQSARQSPDSPFRDFYLWSAQEPADRKQGMVFPGEQTETWTYDDQAHSWYFHRFYNFQPDLNWANPAVRAEIKKVMGFWLALGASGFRIDAAPFVLEMTSPDVAQGPKDFTILDEWRQHVQWRTGDAVLLCEANVDPPDLTAYTRSSPAGPNDRAHMMFSFLVNPRLWLALARQQAEPLVEILSLLPDLAEHSQWATFLRNHDELDLSRLTESQRAKTFAAFAPRPTMREFGRGIRRRSAPMLGNDARRIQLAYSLQFSMPGTPVLRYGEEIGMGENLNLPGRNAICTPMQWDDTTSAGFSTATELPVPVVNRGAFSFRRVNVRAQQRDPDSLLRWFEQLVRVVKQTPEIGQGRWQSVDLPLPPSVLAHRFDGAAGSVVLLHNLADVAHTVDLSTMDRPTGPPLHPIGGPPPWEVFADGPYPPPPPDLSRLELGGYGFRWIRLASSITRGSLPRVDLPA